MTLQEILKAKGLSDADIESVLGEMKQNKIFTTAHENMDVRYPKLKGAFDNLTAQHGESTSLIEQLKADAQNNEQMGAKITQYETTIGQLNDQLKQTRLDAAIHAALVGANVTDVDYMTFRLKESGDLVLDDQGKIKGIDDRLAGLKTQYPNFFHGAASMQVQPLNLPGRDTNPVATITKEQFDKMGYKSKVELKQNNPELYSQLTKG